MASRVSFRGNLGAHDDEEAGRTRRKSLAKSHLTMSSIGLSKIGEDHHLFMGLDEDLKQIVISTIHSMDADGDERLDMDEVVVGVINAAKEAKQAAVNEAALTKKLKRANYMSMFTTFFMAVAVIAAIVLSLQAGNQQVESTIAKNTELVLGGQATEVAVDPVGQAHLVDKSTQQDVGVRAMGVVANAESRSLEGRELVCVPVHDIAAIVYGLTTSTASANLITHDNNGAIKDVIPMSGEFHDANDSLVFAGGSVTVRMDSDVCNISEDGQDEEEAVNELTEPESSTNPAPNDNTDGQAQTNDGESAGPFKRRLKPRTTGKAVISSDVLALNRQLYTNSLEALSEGRRLTGTTALQVCSGDGCTISVRKIVIAQHSPAYYGPFNSNDKRTTLTLAEVQVISGGTNVAEGKTANQSSTYGGGASGPWGPGSAVDGKPDTFNHVGMTDDTAWWELDLGQFYPVSSIVIHNRQDCCQYQNAYALVKLYGDSDKNNLVHMYSLGDTNGLASHTFDASSPIVTTIFPVRSIRVEQNHPALYGFADGDKRTTLTLTEVQVFDASGTNVAEGKTTVSQSSTYDTTPSYGPASFAVDGNLDTFNHVGVTTDQAWWELDLGNEYGVSEIVIHNRVGCCQYQNANAVVKLYDGNGREVYWYSLGDTSGSPSHTLDVSQATPPPTPAPTPAPPPCTNCCNGINACPGIDPTKLPNGSCNGNEACVGVDPSKLLGENSCYGYRACYMSSATIGAGSCRGGSQACAESAGRIGARSCVGRQACYEAGKGFSRATIGQDCCNGELACFLAGFHGQIQMGDGSCKGYRACDETGLRGTAFLGERSCVGDNVCKEAGSRSHVCVQNNSNAATSAPCGV